MEHLRVLHVFGALDRGGMETMIMNIYRKIDKKKVQFDFIVQTEKKGAFEDEIERLGGCIYRVPRFTLKHSLQYIYHWIKFLKKHKEYRIIHSHINSTASIFLSIAKYYKFITIIHSHNTSYGKGISAIIKSCLSTPLKYLSCSYYFACSKAAGEWLFGTKFVNSGNRNFYILKNAIDAKAFTFDLEKRAMLRKKMNLENKLVIGHVGRFESQKNHSYLIQIFSELEKIKPDSILLLIGGGELQTSIRNMAEKYNLSRKVLFLGSRPDVADLMQAMDLFIFPSLYEGLPVTLIEAQASGLKSIVSDTITPEVCISEEIEYVSLGESPGSWARRALAARYVRKDMQGIIKEHGYDIETTAKWIEDFYIKIYDQIGRS